MNFNLLAFTQAGTTRTDTSFQVWVIQMQVKCAALQHDKYRQWHWYMVVAFSLLVRILGECLTTHSPPAFLCVCVCFCFFEVEISSHTLLPLFRPGSVKSGSVSWDNRGRVIPDKLHVSSFPDTFLHYSWTAARSAQSDFHGSRVYTCLGVTWNLHFWQNDRSLLCATVVTWGWKRHQRRVTVQS